MGLGIAFLTLLGVGLLFSVFDDDDDTNSDADDTEPQDARQNLNTTDASETLVTGNANDVVRSQGGDDLVSLGDGNDRAFGGRGVDAIFGGDGKDLMRGQQSNDQLFGGDGEDTLFGDTGNDTLYGDDLLNDAALFSATATTGFLLFDNTASIDPSGDTGTSDTLSGGEGNDAIFAGGNDVVDTGNGEDAVILGDWINEGQSADIVAFDPDEDFLVYSYANGEVAPALDVTVNEDGVVALTADGETVATLPNVAANDVALVQAFLVERPEVNAIETFIGSDQADVIRGTATNDIISAEAGNDRVFARAGSDLVIGDFGNDFLRGEAGNDALFGDGGNDTLNGDAGSDVLFGADILSGVSIRDLVSADLFDSPSTDLIDFDDDIGESDTLNGGVGDDTIVAGSNDVVNTGLGADVLSVGQWIIPNEPVDVVDFTPTEDVVVYSYIGSQPDVVFSEASDGTAVLLEGGRIVARFPGLSVADLNANSQIILEDLTAG